MKKIHDIISSELVVRTNNVRFRQEFGEVDVAPNIENKGNSTIFTTKYKIDKVVYVTVNGVNLTEGEHYYITSDFTISISNQGSPLRPSTAGEVTNILVGYFFENRSIKSFGTTKIPPIINTFYLNINSGRDDKIIFNFAIEQRDGKNIFWSILKDGEDTPIYSGSELATANGMIVDSTGNLVELNYFVSPAEYQSRVGEKMPFTLVVVYDLTEDGSRLDEKLLAYETYEFLYIAPILGSITSLPALIGQPGPINIDVDYTIGNPDGVQYEWKVTRAINGANETIIDQGVGNSGVSSSYVDNVSPNYGDHYYIRYALYIKASNEVVFTMLSNDRTTISIAMPTEAGNAGYLDAAIMNFQDPNTGNWRKIGDTHTSQDLIDYNAKVPREIFTKSVPESYLNVETFIAAPVWNPYGNISQVYFILEAPNSWGPIEFHQALGEVDISSFNQIDLGNGFTAYLYKAAPSAVSNPSDYFIKRA